VEPEVTGSIPVGHPNQALVVGKFHETPELVSSGVSCLTTLGQPSGKPFRDTVKHLARLPRWRSSLRQGNFAQPFQGHKGNKCKHILCIS
jgi:hypothetical protein